ncbi:MAG: threonine-phosphate decarboxylase [Nitrospirae bacterium]|uniref:threonine-phosphate decarboxylase CobD n=1 Tax=Candidatus Magnetobacterium casense TaxID=1455061 RepID=UPI00058AE340|nr:threonine-phosphate decarboxylase CobD [Candidatus Magnetobacterium casensis]MBF0338612.1 threonine-phosphate decarboxylase [Nitrospirota bacterium]
MQHGGDIYGLASQLRLAERKIVDFSASINPLGISKKVKAEIRTHLKYLPNYPDPQCRRLRKHLAIALGVDAANIICGNGSTELIYLIARVVRPRRALVLAPTFMEYERALLASEVRDVRVVQLEEGCGFRLDTDAFKVAMIGCGVAFLCNPNSPTAQYLTRAEVLDIADYARGQQCLLVVDEAFIDFLPQQSVVSEVANNPWLIVLRSMTKFYGLSGLRLGMAVMDTRYVELLEHYKEPWSVNTLAQRAGVTALNDKAYVRQTFEVLRQEKRYVEDWLTKKGFQFYPSEINFYLLKDDRAPMLYEKLRAKGILLRNCAGYRGLDNRFLRIAVKAHRQNTILYKAISRLL